MNGRARALILSTLLLASGVVLAVSPPPRYVPAPKGRTYFLAYFGVYPLGTMTASESDVYVAGRGNGHKTDIKWTYEKYELGGTLGYGFGPLGFMRGTEGSLFVPVTTRSYFLSSYLVDGGDGIFVNSLHNTMRDRKMGMAMADIQASLMGLLYADASAGTWMSGTVKMAAPTGASAAKRYTQLLHGMDSVGPADGAGVPQVIPGFSLVQSIVRQRLFFNVEYSVPLGKEKFNITTGEMTYETAMGRVPTADSNTEFTEEFKRGGVIAGTLGLETSFEFFGIAPGMEITVRQYGKTKWTENGKDGLASSTAAAPRHTLEFLNTSGWALGNIPLKATTEIEMGLTGSKKMKVNDTIKGGIFYIWNSYGSMIGAKLTMTNLFEAISEEDQIRNSGPGAKAMELNVSPVFDAPPPPSGNILTGVATPVSGAGVTEETIVWTTKELRKQLDKFSSYRVMSAKEMAQLAEAPCGDAECGTRYGRVLKQQAVVVGRMEKSGTGFVLTLKMIDVGAGKVSSTASASAKDLNSLRLAIPDLLQRLTSPAEAPAQQGGAVR